jgi:hypothetical protein
MVLWEFKVRRELREVLDSQVLLAQLELQALMVLPESKVQQELWEALDSRD